jgi:hypothetical protein
LSFYLRESQSWPYRGLGSRPSIWMWPLGDEFGLD